MNALNHYKNKTFLKPIQNVRKELLATILYNRYTFREIEDIQYILSRFSDSNFVKLWLINKLEQDKIIINAKINEGTGELFYKIKNIKTVIIDQISMEDIDVYLPPITIYQHFNIIEEDDLKCKPIFEINDSWSDLLTLNNYKLNELTCGCYIITFKNKLYYYIGSSIDIRRRISSHVHNFYKYYQALKNKNDKDIKSSKLNEMIKFYLNSIILFYGSVDSLVQRSDLKFISIEEQIIYEVGFNINILYLSTNYLNLFKRIYPDYNLCKGEIILLTKITDFITRTLEYSLIKKFDPKLNLAYQPVYKHFQWNDEYLDNYSKNKILTGYSNNKKYAIYICTDKTQYPDYSLWDSKNLRFLYEYINDYFPMELFPEYKYEDTLICVSTLQDICSSYNLREYEVLGNFNHYHNYKETLLKNPLKIVEVN